MSEEDGKYQRFGKYLILDHLVDGGMAKICRARFLGEQANKIMAVKMVQPQFSKDPAFVQMFEDELKVCFGLLHPNVAATYDYGMVDGQLFTAMELIEGKNLKEFLDRLKEKKFVFPVEISTYITSQMCQGLHYSHTFTDKLTNKPMNIIHRDISPHNIMVTYDGAVKVIDFGIAKADSNSEATQAGTIKGKLSYLAPEYLEGLTLDPRYDIFAVGITLWELLCSRRLFTAPNDLAVLKQIQNCKIPVPSSVNPNVPKALDEIVLKALSKDRTLRYDDMDQFNRALNKFLYQTYPDFNPTDLKYFATELFKEEIAEDIAKFEEFGKIDIRPYIKEYEDVMSGNGPSKSEGATSSMGPTKQTEAQMFEFSNDELGGLQIDGSEVEEASAKDQSGAKPIKKGSFGTQTAIKLSNIEGKSKTSSTRKKVKKRSDMTATSLRNPNLKAKAGTKTQNAVKRKAKKVKGEKGKPPVFVIVIAASLVSFAYFVPSAFKGFTGMDPFGRAPIVKDIASNTTEGFESFGDEPVVKKKETAKSKKDGVLQLRGYDPYMKVYIGDRNIEYDGGEIQVNVGSEIAIRIEKKGHIPFEQKITLSSENQFKQIVIPELEKSTVGLLTTSMNYNGQKLKVVVHGKEKIFSLPVENLRLPAGSYDAVIENEMMGTEKEVQFTIEENRKNFLE
jgi:serine/threonine protein kinase